MENGQHANSSTAPAKLYISDRSCETPGVVELTLSILPAFNLRSTEAVLVELLIDAKPRGQRLIEGSSPDRNATFTALDKYWRANRRKEVDAKEACLHITHGILILQASSKPESFKKIKGNTYKVFHQLTNQKPTGNGRTDNDDVAEPSKADDFDHELSQENFYDARSQFENVTETPTPEEEPAVEDLVAAGDDSIAADDSPTEHRHTFNSSVIGKAAGITFSPTEDKLARLDRAKRVIFQDHTSPSMELVTAPSPAPVNASYSPVQDSDTEMFDGLDSNTEQDLKNHQIAPRQTGPMHTFGTISERLSSNKSAAQHGINNGSIDPDDEAAGLVHNPKPLTLRRTSHAASGSVHQLDASISPVGNSETKEDSLNGKDDSDTDEGETARRTARTSTKPKDADGLKAYEKWRATSGAKVTTKLRAHLTENDKNIGGKNPVKLWNGKHFGDREERRVANIRLLDIIKKQVEVHNLLVSSANVRVAADLRQTLQPWDKDKIDKYESQLDATLSALEGRPSANLVTSKQQADSDPAEDSNDDFALPLLGSQQRKMAAALLPEDQPTRSNTETKPRESLSSDQRVQPYTSPTMTDRVDVTPEDSDDGGLLDPMDLFPSRLPRAGFTEAQPGRNAGGSVERPKKKPKME